MTNLNKLQEELTKTKQELHKSIDTNPFSLLETAKELVTVNAKLDLIKDLDGKDSIRITKMQKILNTRLTTDRLDEQDFIEINAKIQLLEKLLA